MNRIAVVTGGSGGIGRAIVLRLLRDGFQVIALYCRNRNILENLCQEAREKNLGQMYPMQCDVTDPNSVTGTFSEIHRIFHHIDLLVCAQGVASIRLFTDTDEEEWNRILSVNLTGTYRAIYAALPGMITRKSGNIITISSMWGEVGASCEAAYSASKAGIIGLTKALAKELGPSGIRVNCVSPGVIATAMNQDLSDETMQTLCDETPLERIGTPEDVAEAVAFLASQQSSFITGQILGVSGGMII